MKSWLPLLDRLTVKQDAAPLLHPGTGIVMSDQDREKYRPNTGVIVLIGPGKYVNGQFCPIAPALQPGVRIQFSPVAGTPVDHNGEEHLQMREDDAFGIIA